MGWLLLRISAKILTLLRLKVKIFQFLRLSAKFLAVLRLSVNPIKTLFLRGLFLEAAYIRRGLSTEGNLRFKIDWASLTVVGRKFTIFSLFYFVFEGNFPCTSPGGLIFGGGI